MYTFLGRSKETIILYPHSSGGISAERYCGGDLYFFYFLRYAVWADVLVFIYQFLGFSVWGCKERHVCVWVRLFGGEVFRI